MKNNIIKNIIARIVPNLLMTFTLGLLLYSCNQKVSVTPPDMPPPDGFVYISSNPEGFQIYLNGLESRRATPDSLTWLSTGTYVITLKKELFKDTSFNVNIVEGKKLSTFIDFFHNLSMRGSIYCSSSPEGAKIFLNDSNTGIITPGTIKNIFPGNYEIKCKLLNYTEDSLTVAVSSGKTSSVKMILVDSTLWSIYTTENSPFPTNNFTCINIDKKGIVWAGTDGRGVLDYDGKSWSIAVFNDKLPYNYYINCISVNSINVIFVGTNKGFVTFDGVNTGVYSLKTLGTTLPSYVIYSIGFDAAGSWYIGTEKGLARNNGMWDPFINKELPDTIITSICNDNLGNLWVGTEGDGIAVKNNTDNWKFYTSTGNTIINNNITAISASPSGDIWIGYGKLASGGTYISNYKDSVWSNVYVLPYSSQVNGIIVDKNNVKWVATDKGLVRFTNSADATVFNYDNTGLNINDVTGVAQDVRGNIWISTMGGGLVEYKGNH